MRMQPLISVLIATYNRPQLLKRAVRSVLWQFYPNLELIIVDDHSETEAATVLNEFDTSNINCIRNQRNLGFAKSINIAAKKARGDYLAILGDDDAWTSEEKLARQMQILSEDSEGLVAVVCTGFQYISEGSDIAQKKVIPLLSDDFLERLLVRNGIVSSTTVMIRKHVWNELGGFAEDLPRGVDSDFFRRVLFAGYRIESIPEVMVNVYVGRDDRMGTKNSIERIEQHMAAERYKLDMYPDVYLRYPAAKSRVFRKIARHQLQAWNISRKGLYLLQALCSLIKSFLVYPDNAWKMSKDIPMYAESKDTYHRS